MKRSAVFGLMTAFLIGGAAFADDKCRCKPGEVCPPPHCVRETCFNIVCSYKGKDDHSDKKCEAAAKFMKKVTRDGGEIAEDLDTGIEYERLKFEVKCGNHLVYNDGGRRFTDMLGTRIQGIVGPYPAILLPRGELHEGHHYSPSYLELGDDTLRGACYIYTGQP